MKRFLIPLLLCLLLLPIISVNATEETPILLYTAEDLIRLADDPTASYRLMEDIDMTGISWKSIDFSGNFDGNGHALLNLTLSEPSEQMPKAYDGNWVSYESRYIGFFGVVEGARIENLNLVNVRAVIETDEPCFLGGLAGYAVDTTFANCRVSGSLELRAHEKIFGVGGMIGYGRGSVENCVADVTLICVDTDATTRDEQFLGGVYSTGFFDVFDSTVTIDGYISEHGYVHSGGITGMYMQEPNQPGKEGHAYRNTVTGKITFFEDNSNRRAYCKALFGEVLISSLDQRENVTDFERDEVFEYDCELRPEMCELSVDTAVVTPSGCDTFGYTTHTCEGCGYSYTDAYTLYSHTVTDWTVRDAPTTEEEGLSVGYCDLCGAEQTRIEPVLPPTEPPTEAPTEPETTHPETIFPETIPTATQNEKMTQLQSDRPLLIIAGAVVLLSMIGLVAVLSKKK